MSSKVRAWLCLGLMTVQTLQTVAYLGSSFKILSEMKDIRFDLEIIFSLSTWSPLDCSRKCEIHNTCLSFQYSHLSGQCRLFNTIYLHQDAGVYDIGWQYYITSKRMWHIIIIRDIMSNNRLKEIMYLFYCLVQGSNLLGVSCTKQDVHLQISQALLLYFVN